MKKYVNKNKLFRYINLFLLILVWNYSCSELAAAYDRKQNQETYEMNDYENTANVGMDKDNGMDTENGIDEENGMDAENEIDKDNGMNGGNGMDKDRDTMEIADNTAAADRTAADCFYTGNGDAAGSFSSRLSAEDYDCLLRIVEAEAGICDEKGKILVANVVLNRMETEEFPDTVREVVYQERQFSPVSSGRIDQVTITDETVEAVRKALEGTDYSEGALFFVARKHAEKENLNWFDNSLEFLFEHDGHEFFKCKSQ